jgi:hypothetical protein
MRVLTQVGVELAKLNIHCQIMAPLFATFLYPIIN